MAGITKILTDPVRQQRCTQAHNRRLIGRRSNNNRTLLCWPVDILANKITHLAPALTNHGQHDNIRRGVPGNHAQQSTLAASAGSKQTNTLTTTNGE